MKQRPTPLNLRHLFIWTLVILAQISSAKDLPAQKTAPPKSLEISNLWLDEMTIEAVPPTYLINDAYLSLWLASLKSTEIDLSQELVATLEQIHKKGVDQTAISSEIRSLLSPDNHHTMNMALASLLVSLDDKESAKLLFELLQPGRIELSQIIEPALANWNFEPIKPVWRLRLKEQKIRRTHLILAIKNLGDVRDKPSTAALKALALDRSQSSAIRMAAARALGNIHNGSLTQNAQTLATRTGARGIIDRLCGVALLGRHQSDASNKLLQKLLLDQEGAVAGAAWQRLLEIDSSLAVPAAEACHDNPDPLVRQHVVTSLHEQPTKDRMSLLGKMISDRHPDVRTQARRSLFQLANQSVEFDAQARAVGMKIVTDPNSSFRGIEQALVLLASLDHKPVANAAVGLLNHDHPKVMIASAWALRILLVEETFPAMLQRAESVSKVLIAEKINHPLYSKFHMDQVAHLYDSFGASSYQPAEQLMRKFIPKQVSLLNNCRPAAITAIGKLNRGKSESALVKLLIERMNDQIIAPPETEELCAACAMALARMGAQSAVGDIQKYYEGTPPVSGLIYAAAWSIRELTGKNFPPPASPILKQAGFNLEPGYTRIKDAGGAIDVAPSNEQ
ncbi:MAG: hypothetical protein P8J27_11620 [Mariniblastus sp.]|nr:hypothetical protein [Mariniblastus sp.]